MSKATLLTRYVTLAEKKARVEAEMLEARIALFEAHGYAYCRPGDPRRAELDQGTRDRWLCYKLAPPFSRNHLVASLSWLIENGQFTAAQIEEERKIHARDIERLGRPHLQRPMVLVPDLGWRIASEAWQHLWRAIPRLTHLVDQESSQS